MKQLLDPKEIQTRVRMLGQTLSREYQNRPLTVLGVLTGSLLFMADLIREIEVPHRIGVVHASSYRGRTTTPGALKVGIELMPDIRNRDVLIIDDVFDTGNTLSQLVKTLEGYQPNSVRSAVLLLKEGCSKVDFAPDHFCFRIPDVFVVGYGLDYNDDYRHLPYVGALEPHEI